MSKLESLSAEQEKLMYDVRDEWIDFCLGGHDEVTTTQEQVDWLYSLASLPAPRMMIVDSPKAAMFAADALLCITQAKEKGEKSLESMKRKKLREEFLPVREKALRDVWEQVPDLVGDLEEAKRIVSLYSDLNNSKISSPRFFGLSKDSGWVSFYDFFSRIGIVKHENFLKYKDFLKSGVWGGILYDTVAILIRRPNLIKRNNRFDLHSIKGPAIAWRDGYSLYFVHGISVDRRWVDDPLSLTAEEILEEDNVEVRRTMIDLLGAEEFCKRAKFEIIDEDFDRTGQSRRLLRRTLVEDEDMVVVNVNCPSTSDSYYHRVPPNMKTCAQAVAWTFEKDVNTYAPLQEA